MEDNAGRARPKGYYFLTAVWGESYTRLFLDIALPAQLAPGNLPAFQDNTASRYVIFTTEKDAETIRSAPVFKPLSKAINVHIEIIERARHQPHDLMSACHKRGIEMANAADAAAFFLNPDLVFSDGSFATARRLAEAGTDVILITGIRTLKHGAMQALQSYRAHNMLLVPPRALMQIALDHLHPLADSSWWDEGASDLIPANLYWRVSNEGIVARCFHLHPLMVYPQRKDATFFGTVDDDFVPAACPDASHDYIITDSDALLVIELSNPAHVFLTGCRKGSMDDCVVWAERFADSRHRSFFHAVICMHTGMRDREAWKQAKEKASTVADEICRRLALPMAQLCKTFPRALKARLIRWAQDRELARVNRQLGAIELRAPATYLARALGLYFRSARRIAAVSSQVKDHIFGALWTPHLWTWGYRYTTQLKREAEAMLRSLSGDVLVITPDPARSLARHILRERCMLGMLMADKAGVRLLDYNDSGEIEARRYSAIVIERLLPPARHSEAAMQEIARVLAPEGKFVAIVNRAPSPGDPLDNEICMTTGALASLLAPEFRIISQRSVGSFSWGWLGWVNIGRVKLKAPFFVRLAGFVLLLPLNLLGATLANLISPLLESLDTSGRDYMASITLAVKE